MNLKKKQIKKQRKNGILSFKAMDKTFRKT